MTAGCPGGGPSGTKPGTAPFIAFTAAAVSEILTAGEATWLIPFIAAAAAQAIESAPFCAADPPSPFVFTDTDMQALQRPWVNPVATGVAIQHGIQLFQSCAWHFLCQCNDGTLIPVPQPIIQPPASAATFVDSGSTLCVRMVPSQVRILNLWNTGTNDNNDLPTGWDTPTFDDSSWPFAVSPTVPAVGSGHQILNVLNNPSGTGVCTPDSVCSSYPMVAPTVLPVNDAQQFLMRWRFDLPNSFDPREACIQFFSSYGSTGLAGWSNVGLSQINGAGQFVSFNTLAWQTHIVDLKPGPNLWAQSVEQQLSNPLLWFGTCGVQIAINQAAQFGGSSNTGCCPPDPTIQQQINSIYEMVRLLQRYSLPFAYVSGAVHSNLTGSGSFAISRLSGVRLHVSTVPQYSGIEVNNPNRLFDIGWVSYSTPDGVIEQRQIANVDSVWQPRYFAEGTVFGYSLNPSAVLQVTELQAET